MLVNVGKLMSHTSTKGGGGVKHPFNPSLVDAWFMSGLSNSDKPSSIRGVKGNEMQLKNFAYALSSGFGKYAMNFNSWENINATLNCISIFKEAGISEARVFLYYNQLTSNTPSYSVKITGLNSGNILFYYRNKEGIEEHITYNKDGIYQVPVCYKDGTSGISTGFTIKSTDEITITQLPEAYEGALVFDGVDDYGICDNLPILTDYTVICRRSIITVKKTSATASKCSYPDDVGNSGAFILEAIFPAGNKSINSFGFPNGIDNFDENEIVYQTKTSYNGKIITSGYGNDSEYLCLGAKAYNVNLNKCQEFSNIAVYYFALYDKSLTPEEIEEEKVKLENYWEGGKNELA